MDREQARAEYRRILSGVVRHHQAIDRHVTGIVTARIAKRPGLRVKGGIIEAGDNEMTLLSNLTEPSGPAGSMSPRCRSLSPTSLLDRATLPDDLEAQKTAASAIATSLRTPPMRTEHD